MMMLMRMIDKNNKAQMNHVFTFIMIILLIGLLAVIGYKGVSKIMDAGCNQQAITFERNLLRYIDDYSDRGTVHEEILTVPCGVTEVCFVDAKYYVEGAGVGSAFIDDDGVIKSNIESKTNNIFVKAEFTTPIGFSDKISLPDDISCFKVVGGAVKLVFNGQGRTTLIK